MADGMELRPADQVNTAAVVAFGLTGGFLTGRESGIRPLAGVVLLAAGALAGRTWLKKAGPGVTGGLALLYLAGFGASHPLAKRIGAWPSVLAVTAVNAAASHLLVDRRPG